VLGLLPCSHRATSRKGCGAVSVADQRGTPEMASAELLRYLVEAPLFPPALLPRDGVSWTALDDTRARVTLTDRETTVSCDVSFGEHGEITGASAMRHRDDRGRLILTPWVGRWTDYRRVGGMMIPMSGDVGWVLPDGMFTYWRGRIVDARHEFATAV